MFAKGLALFVTALGLLGCDPRGTCIYEAPPGGSAPSTCVVNTYKKLCTHATDTFSKEDVTAGVVRCKTAGFDFTNTVDIEAETKKDGLIVYFRSTK